MVMGIEYRTQGIDYLGLEAMLNFLATEGWRYVDFVLESKETSPRDRKGVLIMERTVGEPRP